MKRTGCCSLYTWRVFFHEHQKIKFILNEKFMSIGSVGSYLIPLYDHKV